MSVLLGAGGDLFIRTHFVCASTFWNTARLGMVVLRPEIKCLLCYVMIGSGFGATMSSRDADRLIVCLLSVEGAIVFFAVLAVEMI